VARQEPFERVLRLAAYVGEHRVEGCTIRDIAQNVAGYRDLDKSALEKAVGRDLRTMRDDVGIVVEWSDAKQRYVLQPPLFTSEERRALIAAAAAVDVEGLEREFATGELGAAVDEDLARIVVRVHERVVDIRDAIAARRSIRFTYQGNDGAPEPRHVDPYAVGLWRNRWYFVGFDHTRNARRVFRLDRIVTTADEPVIRPDDNTSAYTIPDDVDPIADLTMDPNSWGADRPVLAQMRVVRDLVPMFLGELAGAVIDSAGAAPLLEVEVRDYESFLIRLLGFGTAVQLVAPEFLVTRLRDWLSAQVSP
jgi:predicted DNA-binding transcriptional regulator YafY